MNVYASNITASRYRRQKLIKLKREIGKSDGIAEDFNSSLSVIDRPSR